MNEIATPQEFSDICPFSDAQFKEKMKELVAEDGFKHAVTWVMPDIDFDGFCKMLLQINTKKEFQENVMFDFLKLLAAKTTEGISYDNIEKVDQNKSYTMMTNHRDIVLDASFLNLALLYNHYRTTEVAIGSNLLIYKWIEDLVRINKSVIVKRDLNIRQALGAAEQLSGYIHFAITQKHESVWIAQRQGRAKDSSDTTQESLIKMLAIKGGKSTIDNLLELNIMPVAIVQSLTPFWAGVIIIGPIAATISTVSSLLLSSSSSIVKDVYMNIKGKREEQLTNNQIRLYSLGATIILGLFVYAIAIKPPSVIWQINMFAFGGLETAFFWVLIFGLFWPKANKYGAIAAMGGGVIIYCLAMVLKIKVLDLHQIVLGIGLSLLCFFIGNSFGKTVDEKTLRIFFPEKFDDEK